MSQPIIVWFRRDLRLSDHTALGAALESGQPIVPLFILDDAILKSERTGAPRLKFMLNGLHALDDGLRKLQSRPVIRRGEALAVLQQLIHETSATALYFNRDYSPYARLRDAAIQRELSIDVHPFDDQLLHPPASILKDDGDPYVVYTPFKRKALARPVTYTPHRAPTSDDFYDGNIESLPLPTLSDLGFGDTIDVMQAGEAQAQVRLSRFLHGAIEKYGTTRNDLPVDPDHRDDPGTSHLSPFLHFGMISIRQCWHEAERLKMQAPSNAIDSIEIWQSELLWRDFYHHILYFFPHVTTRSFRPEYDSIQWRYAPDELEAWKNGQTGYSVVDAAMRQLKAIGWMHNRARMIVASFLTKDLLIDWREGERHFMKWLIDGDLAANNGGWQWAAGTGTDAQPYFRIFNPVSQGQKFDPKGVYIRRWVPELRDVSDKYIHEPWKMPTPTANYAAPIVDHKAARERTLTAYKAARDD